MAYLQDANNAARLAEIDRHGVQLLPVWRSRWLKKLSGAGISGHLGGIAGQPAAVYLAGGRLWFAIEGQVWHLDEVEAQIGDVGEGSSVVLRTPQGLYEAEVVERGLADDTPFTDLEDASFALWTARIVLDPERQEVLRDVLRDTSLATMPEHAGQVSTGPTIEMPGWSRADVRHDVKRRADAE